MPKRRKEAGERWALAELGVEIGRAELSRFAMKIEREAGKKERGKKVERSGSVDEVRN